MQLLDEAVYKRRLSLLRVFEQIQSTCNKRLVDKKTKTNWQIFHFLPLRNLCSFTRASFTNQYNSLIIVQKFKKFVSVLPDWQTNSLSIDFIVPKKMDKMKNNNKSIVGSIHEQRNITFGSKAIL